MIQTIAVHFYTKPLIVIGMSHSASLIGRAIFLPVPLLIRRRVPGETDEKIPQPIRECGINGFFTKTRRKSDPTKEGRMILE